MGEQLYKNAAVETKTDDNLAQPIAKDKTYDVISLVTILNKYNKKRLGVYEDVTCPFCGANIQLHKKMEYGYCIFCAKKVSFHAAKNKEYTKGFINHLSGDEYYALMRNDEGTDLTAAETAAEKGSADAAFDLGKYYAASNDFKTAMQYYKSAEDGGNYSGKIQYLLCEGMVMVQSGNITISKVNRFLSELNALDRGAMSEQEKESVDTLSFSIQGILRKENNKAAAESARTAAFAAASHRTTSYTSTKSSLTNEDHDDLDDITKHMHDTYGDNWLKDI